MFDPFSLGFKKSFTQTGAHNVLAIQVEKIKTKVVQARGRLTWIIIKDKEKQK